MLLLLLLLPLLAWDYYRRVGRGSASAHVLYTNVGQFAQIGSLPWQRHAGAWLYLLALGLGIVGLAKPHALIPAPDNLAGVMLAIDISGSMRAQDINPSRMEAAKKAAQTFVKSLPQGAKVGLVTFAGYATLEVPLTADHQRVISQIDTLSMFRGTAIGDGLSESLKAFPTDKNNKLLGPSSVVLLSDGRSNRGMDPLEAAQQAKALGVTVHTIGLGKKLPPDDPQNQGFGFRNFMAFDEETLRAVAQATGGQYYPAESEKALLDAYRKLGRVVGWKPTRTEVSGLTAMLAGLVLFSSLMVSSLRRRVL